MAKTRVGVVGCGNISAIYLSAPKKFPGLEMAACADIDMERAQARAAEYGVAKACTVDELLADDSLDVILCLTIPAFHADICLQGLRAGRHVYTEKPLAVRFEEGQRLMEEARMRNLRVGSAPDTFLGGGLQTCRKLIDDGWIGRPIAATANMMSPGHERWHPDPAFFYQAGGGPMFDMGPYYLTALVSMFGPVRRVSGSAQKTRESRTITSQPKYGQTIDVEVPTHLAAVLDFTNGVVATLVTSFDVWHANTPLLEVYGTEGTLSLPDPNTFGGPVRVRRHDSDHWYDVPLTHGHTENSRGLGLADMARAIAKGRPHRANGDMALHVLELMHGVHESSAQGRHYELTSRCERPAPLRAGPGTPADMFD